MPSTAIIENTDRWTVESVGNGWAYSVYDKRKERSVLWLQDEDATKWREEYDAMERAYGDPRSVWFRKSWNDCLSALVEEYTYG